MDVNPFWAGSRTSVVKVGTEEFLGREKGMGAG